MTNDDSVSTRLLIEHPDFKGDTAHLGRFARLVTTPIHSDERGEALSGWKEFNRVPNLPPGAEDTETGLVKKVAKWQDYEKPRAVQLQGMCFPLIILGTVDLAGAQLDHSNLQGARLKGAVFDGASLVNVDLSGALLLGASFKNADLTGANFSGAILEGADFAHSNLTNTNFSGANLTRADLVKSSVTGANFDRAVVYGISAWDLEGEPSSSRDLSIANGLTVDNIKVAQFLYLIYRNPEIREVLDAVTNKVVLILGRFSEERKPVLDTLRNALRDRGGLIPIVFDFDVPDNRDAAETVTLLARMARFVIADVTSPKAVPFELGLIAPDVAVPIRLIVQGDEDIGMIADLKKYQWVMKPFRYTDTAHLLNALEKDIIAAAESVRMRLQLQSEQDWSA